MEVRFWRCFCKRKSFIDTLFYKVQFIVRNAICTTKEKYTLEEYYDIA